MPKFSSCLGLFISILISNYPQISNSYGHTNFVMKRLEQCERNKIYPLNVNITIKTIQHKPYVDGDVTFAVDVGSNIRSNFSIELLTGKHFTHLISITDKNICLAAHKYLGEFLYDLERHAQIIPNTCPIRKGKYRVHNVELDYNRITLQTVPFGHMRFTLIGYDRENYECLCVIMEVDNHE